MYARRATAAKLAIRDIKEGNLLTSEQGNVVGVETHLGQVSRVNLLATVVDRFALTPERATEEGRGFSTVTLDDGTGVIRVKMWGELSSKIQDVRVGDLVLVIGKVRSFQGETYLNGEVVRKLENPNWETVRRLELAFSQVEPRRLEPRIEATTLETLPEQMEPRPSRQTELEPGVWHSATAFEQQSVAEEEPVVTAEVRRVVLQTIEKYDNEGGARFEQILDATAGASEEEVEQILIDLLSEGLVYEPEIHRYKKS